MKCFQEFKALKLRIIDDVSYTGAVLGMNDKKECIVKWMIGDKEIIIAHGCRQIKNIIIIICAATNIWMPAKKQRAGGCIANDVSSDEEWDNDSGNLVDMFSDVNSVEDGDIEDNSGCNGEDSTLLAPRGRQWQYCTFLDNFDL